MRNFFRIYFSEFCKNRQKANSTLDFATLQSVHYDAAGRFSLPAAS